MSIATSGEDGTVKIWAHTGSLRSTLASCGTIVTSVNWDSSGKFVMFSYGGLVTVRSASFKQDQIQFQAHQRTITCSSWSRAKNYIVTGAEDHQCKLFDSDGRLIAESAPFEKPVTSVEFVDSVEMILVGTVSKLFLLDFKLRVLDSIICDSDSSISVCPDQPRALVSGGLSIAMISIVGKKIVFKDCEVVSENPKKVVVYDLKYGRSEQIVSNEAILDFFLNFGYLIVLLRSKIQIYKMGNWNSPNIVVTRDPTIAISQCLTMFFLVTPTGGQIIGYDGRVISRITDPRIKWDLLSKENVCCSPSYILIVSPDNRKNIFSFAASTGQPITTEPYSHATEIRNIQTNQAGNQAKAIWVFKCNW